MPNPEPPTFRISSVRRATASTRIVRVDLAGSHFSYMPGQAATIGVAGQAETVPTRLRRPRKRAAKQAALEFLIKIEPSGRWGHRFDRLARGMRVALEGPSAPSRFHHGRTSAGSCSWPAAPASRPVRSMIKHIEIAGIPGRARLLYSARTPDGLSVSA